MKEKAKLTEAEIERLLTAEFPQMFNPQGGFAIDAVWFRGCRVRKRFDPQSLRPGGTIAGTTMMALADLGPYVAIHASIGWAPMAVSASLSASSIASDRLLRVSGSFRVRIATPSISSRKRINEEGAALAAAFVCALIVSRPQARISARIGKPASCIVSES